MKPTLSIIIVNWNGRGLLEECFQHLSEFPPAVPYEIIVVDNASSDDSVRFLETKRSEMKGRLRLILNGENVGFGRANNQAMRESSADYFFLLNSDAFVTAGTFDTMIAIAEHDVRVGVVGPLIKYPDGTIQPSVWRNPPTASQALAVGLRLHKLLPRGVRADWLLGNFWPHDEQREVELIPGAAMLIRREVFEQVGGFDEEFFMYGEDLEYAARIRRAGWKLVFTPAAQVVHKNSQSTIKKWGETEKIKRFTRGHIRFMEKSVSEREARSFFRATVLILRLEKLWRALRRRPDEDLQATLDVYLDHAAKKTRRGSVRGGLRES